MLGRSRRFAQTWAYAYRDGGVGALEPGAGRKSTGREAGPAAHVVLVLDQAGWHGHPNLPADAAGVLTCGKFRGIAGLQGKAEGLRERPEWDSNPRITDLQSVPLVHLGIRPD